MNAKRTITLALGCAVVLLLFSAIAAAQDASGLAPVEELGKSLFFDKNLSANGNQSCATCHAPETGFTGPDPAINATLAVYPGSFVNRFGNRKPPTAAYGGDSHTLHYDEQEEVWEGGMFWDGRATGETLGDPLAEQAQGPFLNPLEMGLSDETALCEKVAGGDYAALFDEVWGEGALDCENNVADVYDQIGLSIAAYEKSAEVNPFTSKYDYYLAGEVELTEQEAWGLELFEAEDKGNCAACHPSEPDADHTFPNFTDFTYDNLGVPRNDLLPFYDMLDYNDLGDAWVDSGLGGYLKSTGADEAAYMAEWGKVKVPTLRNVDLRPSEDFVKAYGHNGYFKSLEDIVHFYNTRDVEEANWPEPEVAENVNTDELGDLGLTEDEEAAIVAFLKTLSDGYQP
jgi:cytochrome c peroxidase